MMALQNILLDKIFDNHEAFRAYSAQVQRTEFPWSMQFSIEFLPGHVSIVLDALNEFRAIVGDARVNDTSAFIFWAYGAYGPSVFMFIKDLDEARTAALTERCRHFRYLAAYSCNACGSPLERENHKFCTEHSYLEGLRVAAWFDATAPQSSSAIPLFSSSDCVDSVVGDVSSLSTGEGDAQHPPDVEEAGLAVMKREELVDVWEEKGVELLETRVSGRDSDAKVRIRGVVAGLKAHSSKKPLRQFSGVIHGLFAELRALFPNFTSVTDYMEGQCALSLATGRAIALDPVLIHSRPGLGKTLYLQHLADGLRLAPVLLVDMASAQSGAALAGSETFWANSHEGRLFWHLVTSPVANPVVVLEEIDKVSSISGGSGERAALGALHLLLERSTARRFCDLSLPELLLDASRVLWFATCNDIELVPDPIRQRFVTFEIPSPKENEGRQIATHVFSHFLKDRGLTDVLDRHLSDEVLTVLSALPPREMRKRLTAAAGRAVLTGRSHLIAEDLLGRDLCADATTLAIH
ncbi:AAA family ATPase [Methyloversatilis sp. XJ19-49]|uniref:AAA family ATPase n=1 Tax=Methyloversatilis sp. XJ19-49 TaxID=2963429 RepID=UPI00211CF8F1|nr:AAA family ATPase [Methyloversatilis sp. XJ19-49]MCQ9377783.1 AAA family ATPase [Methyloversatilis sp. XJ19-49]